MNDILERSLPVMLPHRSSICYMCDRPNSFILSISGQVRFDAQSSSLRSKHTPFSLRVAVLRRRVGSGRFMCLLSLDLSNHIESLGPVMYVSPSTRKKTTVALWRRLISVKAWRRMWRAPDLWRCLTITCPFK